MTALTKNDGVAVLDSQFMKSAPTWRPHWAYALCECCEHRFRRARGWEGFVCPDCRDLPRDVFLLRWIRRKIKNGFTKPQVLMLDAVDADLFYRFCENKRIQLGKRFWRATEIVVWHGDPDTGRPCTRFVPVGDARVFSGRSVA